MAASPEFGPLSLRRVAASLIWLSLLLGVFPTVATAQENAPPAEEPAAKETAGPEPVAEVAAPDSRGEPQLHLNFSGTPWREVLQWLAEEADLSLQVATMPSGTFSYSDLNRTYTPSEAIDAMNLVLMREGYAMIRRRQLLVVVDLEDNLSRDYLRELAEVVSPEELDERANTDFVRVTFPLGGLDPEAAVADLEKLRSPAGSVVVLTATRSVVAADTVGVLKSIRDVLRSAEVFEGGVLEIELKHRSADEVLDVARPHLGLEPGIDSAEGISVSTNLLGDRIYATGDPMKLRLLEGLVAKTDLPMASSTEAGGGVAELPELRAYDTGMADANVALEVLQRLLAGLPDVRLTIEPTTQAIIALARPSDHRTIQKTLDEIRGQEEILEVIQLRRMDPQAALLTINKYFGSTADSPRGPTVDGDPISSKLWVKGTAEEIEQVRELITQMEEASNSSLLGERVRVLPYTGRTAEEALSQLEALWRMSGRENRIRVMSTGDLRSGGEALPERRLNAPLEPKATTQPKPKSGAQPQAEPEPKSEAAPEDRSAGASRQGLFRFASDELPSPEEVVQFSGPLSPEYFAGKTSAVPPNSAAKYLGERARVRGSVKADGTPAAASHTKSPRAPENSGNHAVTSGVELIAGAPSPQPSPPKKIANSPRMEFEPKPRFPLEERGPENRTTSEESGSEPEAELGSDIIIRMTPQGLIVASDDTEALEEFEQLFETLAGQTSGAGQAPTVYWLKYIKATVAADLLNSILSGAESSGGGVGDMAGSMLDEIGGGMLGGLLGLGGGGSGEGPVLTTTGSVSIVPDARLNALVIQANGVDLQLIEEVLQVIDREESPEDVQTTPKPALIPVIYQDAADVAAIIKGVYSERIEGQGGNNRQPSPQDLINALRGGRGGRGEARQNEDNKPASISVTVDARSNSLIVSAPPQDFADIRALVEQIDQQSSDSEEAVEVVTLGGNLKAEVVQNALTAILGSQAKMGTTETSSVTTSSATSRTTGGEGASQVSPDEIRQRIEFFRSLRGRGGDGGGGGRSRGGGERGGGERGGGERGGDRGGDGDRGEGRRGGRGN